MQVIHSNFIVKKIKDLLFSYYVFKLEILLENLRKRSQNLHNPTLPFSKEYYFPIISQHGLFSPHKTKMLLFPSTMTPCARAQYSRNEPVSKVPPPRGKSPRRTCSTPWSWSCTAPECRCSRGGRWPRRSCARPSDPRCSRCQSSGGRSATSWCRRARCRAPRRPGLRSNWNTN